MKKLLTLISAMLLICCVAFSSTAASNSYEREDNNSYTKANTIQLGNTISGTISNSSDEDYYKITTSADGKVSIAFQHKYNNDKYYCWYVYTYVLIDDELVELSYNYIRSSDKESISIPAIGAKSGTSYFIRIKNADSSAGIEYQLQTSFSKTTFYEKERNNSYLTATNITLDNTYGGNINNSSDEDYYKITTGSDGKVSLAFKHKYNNDKYYCWYVYTYVLTDGELVELSYNYIRSSDKESISIPAIGAKSGTSYFIRIKNADSSAGIEYQLQTSFSKTAFYEKERNNSYPTATNISLNNTYSGNINSGSDDDYYKINTVCDGNISISFKHKYNSDKYYCWYVYTYVLTDGELVELSYNYIRSSDKESISIPAIGAKNGTSYFIRIKNADSSAGIDYQLQTSFSISSPYSIKSSSIKTSSMKVSWSQVVGASGYLLYSYDLKTGNYKKVATTKSNVYKVSSLKAGTVYRYAVKAYKKVIDATYYSDYSPLLVTATKPEAVQNLSVASTAKKTVKITFDKAKGANGYVVYYATSQNGKYKKLATTTKTTYTNKKLTSGTTYYFKVRAFTKVGDEKIYAGYSPIKSIRVK